MRSFELTVGEDDRVIVVTDYVYHAGRPMRPSSVRFDPPEPPEPAELYDIECHWQDTGAALTADEWTEHEDRVTDECWERIRERAEEGPPDRDEF